MFLPENIDYPARNGRHVLSGARQSIPSSNIDNCAGVSVTLLRAAEGQTNRPFSKRLENRLRWSRKIGQVSNPTVS